MTCVAPWIALAPVPAGGGALAGTPAVLPGVGGGTDLPAAVSVFCATFLFAQLGCRIAHRRNARRIRVAFARFHGIGGGKMLSEAFT